MKAASYYDVFTACVRLYHLVDDVNQRLSCPYSEGSFEEKLFRKCEIDTVQWHLEDLIRDPGIDPCEALGIKRRIDELNQRRTDCVEEIDDYFVSMYRDRPVQSGARHNTESIGWAIDRLSILSLKIYHIEAELRRHSASEGHRAACVSRRALLCRQLDDLLQSIDWLDDDLAAGVKKIKTYRQVKMYNDPELNPVLYGQREAQL
ncbi:MAG: DUF4254 domain-containing protein [Bacteroidetes bacterium]|nr:DUF4254 domain-containing protein [Bacteroidota bacterium]